MTFTDFCPFVCSPPFLASPAFFCAALFLLTNDALPFGPNLAAFALDRQAEYGAPFSASPHLPNRLPVEEYLSQPPPPAPPAPPLPNHFRKSSLVAPPQNTHRLSFINLIYTCIVLMLL